MRNLFVMLGIGAGCYYAFKKTNISFPMNGADNTGNCPPFMLLESNTQSLLLRCYAADYTSPRMIADDSLYDRAVNAANESGAPCGWIQFILSQKPSVNLNAAIYSMLECCDNAVKNQSKIDLAALRMQAITKGLTF